MKKTEPLLKQKIRIMKALQPKIKCPRCGTVRKISKEETDKFLSVNKFNNVDIVSSVPLTCKECHVIFRVWFKIVPPKPYVVLPLEIALRNPTEYFKVEIMTPTSTEYDSILNKNPEKLSTEQLEHILAFHSEMPSSFSYSRRIFQGALREFYKRGLFTTSKEPKQPKGILARLRKRFS